MKVEMEFDSRVDELITAMRTILCRNAWFYAMVGKFAKAHDEFVNHFMA